LNTPSTCVPTYMTPITPRPPAAISRMVAPRRDSTSIHWYTIKKPWSFCLSYSA